MTQKKDLLFGIGNHMPKSLTAWSIEF